MLHRWEDDGEHFLLIRRSLTDPQDKRYYFVFAPQGTTLAEMVQAIGARWRVEEDFENSKDLGMDQYEVRSFVGWYRHVTLVMLAHAFLVGICAARRRTPVPAVTCSGLSRLPMLPLTVPEVRRLLARLIWPAPCSLHRVLAWSRFRRTHQRMASYYHTAHRLKTG